MSARTPRFEIVTSDDARTHARYVSSNGRIVWWTESYAKRKQAERAVELITGHPVKEYDGAFEVAAPYTLAPETGLLEVRYVDEREAS